MMPFREIVLQETFLMFKKTGLFLLSLQKNGIIEYASFTDDPGLYVYSCMIANFFNIDPVQSACYLVKALYGITFVGLVIGLSLLSKNLISKTIPLFFLFWLAIPILKPQEVYVAYFFAFLPIPFLLFFLENEKKKLLYGSLFLTGFICAFANAMRMLASLPTMFFILIVCVFSKNFSKQNKAVLLGCFFLGYIIPWGYTSYEIKKSLNYCGKINDDLTGHVFWHNTYIGFGFLANNKGIIYDDNYGLQAAQAINKNVVLGTRECEKIQRNLILKLAKESLYFFMTTIFAKIGVILFFFLWMFGWIGMLCSYFYPKPWFIELAFFITLGIAALPGIMTYPHIAFLIGFFTCTILYTVYGLIYALNAGMFDDIKLFVRRCLKKEIKY